MRNRCLIVAVALLALTACTDNDTATRALQGAGYEASSLRRRESETERQLRAAREALDMERMKVRVLTDALHGRTGEVCA